VSIFVRIYRRKAKLALLFNSCSIAFASKSLPYIHTYLHYLFEPQKNKMSSSGSSNDRDKLAALRQCAANDLITLLPRVCRVSDEWNTASRYEVFRLIPNSQLVVGIRQLVHFLTCPVQTVQNWEGHIWVPQDAQEDFERICPLLSKLGIVMKQSSWTSFGSQVTVYILKRRFEPLLPLATLVFSFQIHSLNTKREWYRPDVEEEEEGPVRKRKRLYATCMSKTDRDRIRQLPLEWDLAVSVKMRDIIIRLLSTRLPICKDIARHITSFVHVSTPK